MLGFGRSAGGRNPARAAVAAPRLGRTRMLHNTARRMRQPTFHPSVADEHPEEMIPGEILSATRMSFFIIFPPSPSALPIQGSQAATSRRPVPSRRNAYDFLGIATEDSPAGVKIFTCRRPGIRPMVQNIHRGISA